MIHYNLPSEYAWLAFKPGEHIREIVTEHFCLLYTHEGVKCIKWKKKNHEEAKHR